MSGFDDGGGALAFLLGSALLAAPMAAQQQESPPPPPAPVVEQAERAEEPGAEQRARFLERLERLREIGGEGDFSGFAEEAEREAQRRRDEALQRGASLYGSAATELEEEMFREQLRELGVLEDTGCFVNEPDLSNPEQDLFRHRRLTRDDFQYPLPKQRRRRKAQPAPSGAAPDATLFVVISCTLEAAVEETPDGRFATRATAVNYFALGSRLRSRWEPAAKRDAAQVLEHQQGHLELARLVAEDLALRFREGRVALRSEGASRASALGLFQQRFREHLGQAQAELRALAGRYDEETRYGAAREAQRRWNRRWDGVR